MSWAEDLKSYETQKQSLPGAFSTAEPVRRITKGGGTREARQQRDYNILNNAAPSAERERQFRTERDATQTKQRERAVAKQLATTQHNYNIITMAPTITSVTGDYNTTNTAELGGNGSSPRITGNQEYKGKKVHKDGNTFVSTAQYALHPEVWQSPPITPRTKAKAEVKLARAEGREREYNIVNQEYRIDHDSKAERDRLEERKRVNAVAMLTDSYNPLTCKYRHLDDEAKAKEDDKYHRVRIPEPVKKSEGHAYDIVNSTVISSDQTSDFDKKRMRGVGPRRERLTEWEHTRDAHEGEAAVDKIRSLNRVNQPRRDAEALSHGYDILSNRPFETDVGAEAAANNSIQTRVPLSQFRPTSTIESIRLAQKAMPPKPAPYDKPRTTHDRLFFNPSRPVAEVEMREAKADHLESLKHLPAIGSGVVAQGWDPSQAQSGRDLAAFGRAAGGAANNLSKNEMGKSSLKRVGPLDSSSASASVSKSPAATTEGQKTIRSAGAGGNNMAKLQLKPLVSTNLLASSGNNGMRSFF